MRETFFKFSKFGQLEKKHHQHFSASFLIKRGKRHILIRGSVELKENTFMYYCSPCVAARVVEF